MKFWKEYGLQLLSLGLCAILLAIVLNQRAELTKLRTEADEQRAAFEQRTDDLQAGLAVLEKPTCTVTVSAVNVREHTVTLDVTVAAPDGIPDVLGAYFLRVVRGIAGPERFDLYMEPDGDGIYSDSAELPLDTAAGLDLVSDGEVLYRCDSMAELLPVRMARASGNTVYNQELKQLFQAEWEVELTDPQGVPAAVTDTAYHVYQNGELMFSGPCYAPEPHEGVTALEGWGLSCKEGDLVELRYACTDTFGLSYEFPLKRWSITDSTAAESEPPSFVPTVTWSE